MNQVRRRVSAAVNPVSTAATRWWCHSALRHMLTGYGRERETAVRAVASESFPVHVLRGADEAAALLNAEDRKCAFS